MDKIIKSYISFLPIHVQNYVPTSFNIKHCVFCASNFDKNMYKGYVYKCKACNYYLTLSLNYTVNDIIYFSVSINRDYNVIREIANYYKKKKYKYKLINI